ncbi:ubiquitin carboxyl-terminal hydrolase-domain-containing protein [Flagelloscypha sp. PMI_526]|nr:ubiquitin carboxyl-terminal hydrolase-domain-containing protein [Flagelloscypha sp. PMI_526]
MAHGQFQPIPPLSIPGFQQSVTALSFDPVSDTLWAGSSNGYVHAIHSTQNLHNITFPVGKRSATRKVISSDSIVRAITGGGIGSWSKGGMNKWHNAFVRVNLNNVPSLTTFCPTTNSMTELAVASVKSDLMLFNDTTGDIVRTVQVPSMVNHLTNSHTLLVSGNSDGCIRAHDPRILSGRPELFTKAHLSSVQGVQITGNYVFTIGLGMRQGRPFPDPLVKVWDLRKFKPLAPIPFSAGPSFISTLPRRGASLVVTSNTGLVNIIDAADQSGNVEFCQLDSSVIITSVAVSPTGAYIAAGDADGTIHLLSQAALDENPLPFNGFDGKPVEWVDSVEPPPSIEWDDMTPLNSIGLPFYEETLLSALPSSVTHPAHTFPPLAQIPTAVLTTMKYNENVAYAPLPKELRGRRNLFVAGIRKRNARFRSGKGRGEEQPDTPTFDYAATGVPKHYRKVEIEYSKFGVEDFDFAFYNKTEFSGLETHILHSYTNPVVQVMNYLPPIRILAKSHITTPCSREHCLLCELGFVVRMLEDARGINCQSSNFCKTVGVQAQAANAIELIDYGRDAVDLNYAHMIQLFNRFLLDHFSSEGNYFPNNPVLLQGSQLGGDSSALVPAAAPVTQLLGIDAKNIITCMNCKATREKENMTHLLDLSYPRVNNATTNEPFPQTDLATVIRNSLFRQIHHKATCQTFNACVYNEETHGFWIDQRKWTFLKPTIELYGQVEGVDDRKKATYEIRAIVIKVVGKETQSHLSSFPEAENRSDLLSPWFVFNDFTVTNITEEEALSFPDKWKVPAILYLQRTDVKDQLDFSSLPTQVDTSILSQDTSISVNRDQALIKHTVLSTEELPKPGTIVAIDAEFVSMQQEEIEYRSDGSHKVIRPARLSLARVSVLRGDGEAKSVPFIDDHIHTSEVIVDYLTEYSGIKFGDLDPVLSPYTLTPLKVVYKKLRMLVDRGCIFIGHGLSKDFRIISENFPPSSSISWLTSIFSRIVRDGLSLRFLSWVVSGELIQTDNHDSIEDARSALNLFTAFQKYEGENRFDEKLEEIYKIGKQYNFKPPVPTTVRTDSPATMISDTQVSNRQNVAAELARQMHSTSPHNQSPVPMFFGSSIGGGSRHSRPHSGAPSRMHTPSPSKLPGHGRASGSSGSGSSSLNSSSSFVQWDPSFYASFGGNTFGGSGGGGQGRK